MLEKSQKTALVSFDRAAQKEAGQWHALGFPTTLPTCPSGAEGRGLGARRVGGLGPPPELHLCKSAGDGTRKAFLGHRAVYRVQGQQVLPCGRQKCRGQDTKRQ